MTKIAVFSKERLFLDALTSLLERSGSYQVVCRETSARGLVSSAKQGYAQILIVDTYQILGDEIQFLLGARAVGEFLVVMISTPAVEHLDSKSVDIMISRASSSDELFSALGTLSPKPAPMPVVREGKRGYRKGNTLSRREYDVACLIARGMSNRTLAEASGLKEQSIKNMVSVIMRKLKCENRTQVALKLLNAEVEEPKD
ncbi:MAG TPA: LuxR C-terminal-related transcriptional regulator [Fimbriimonas sp.]|nr:LuxR C-terminal-related transcriptional regulator [Fimbriimonas sp.]